MKPKSASGQYLLTISVKNTDHINITKVVIKYK